MRGKYSCPRASRAVVNPVSLVLDRNHNCPPYSRSCRSQWDFRKRWLLLAELNLSESPRTQWELHRKVLGQGKGTPGKSLCLCCCREKAGQGGCPVQSPLGASWKRLGRSMGRVKSSLWLLQAVGAQCREHLSHATHKASNKLRSVGENTKSHKLLCALKSRRDWKHWLQPWKGWEFP